MVHHAKEVMMILASGSGKAIWLLLLFICVEWVAAVLGTTMTCCAT